LFLIEALFHNPLLLSALFAGLLSALVSGLIGSYVVVKRMSLLSGGISHSVMGGLGVGLWLERKVGIEEVGPMYGAVVAAILSALFIGWIHVKYRQREDSLIAAFWSIGMAIGLIALSQVPGFNIVLTDYLIGNILWVTDRDLFILSALAILVLASVLLLHRRFLVMCFDKEHAELQGSYVNVLYLFLLVLIALSIVVLVQVVGILLVVTMLTIPAALANSWTTRLSRVMVIAVLLNSLFIVIGMEIAYHLDWPGGATIALLAGVTYLAFLPLIYHGKQGIS